MSDSPFHADIVRIAAGLPQGDETRRKILAALKDSQKTRPVNAAGLLTPNLNTDFSVLKREAKKFASALGKQIKKVLRGAKINVVKTEVSTTQGWDGGYYVVLTVMPKDGEPFNVATTFHSADDGEMSGNMGFDGGGVIPARTHGKTPEQWIQRVVSEAQSMFEARA